MTNGINRNTGGAKGLSEGNEKVKESLEKYKSLNEVQGQIKSLKNGY